MKLNYTYRLLSFLLAITVINSSLYQAYVSMYFFAYQDYIIKELCVQKDNQQGCNGKCYLMKQLDPVVLKKDTPASQPESEKEFRGSFILYFTKSDLLSFENAFFVKKENYNFFIKKPLSISFEKETPPPEFFKVFIG